MTTATAKRSRTRKPPALPTDAATAYAQDVIAGRIVAGRLVRLAAERHLRDLIDGPARGLRWDPEEVEDQRLYFAGLRHTKGEWRGRKIVLEPWQLFVQGSIYGWKRADGTRRFRIALLEVARKVGKSLMGSANGNYLAFDDGEPGAEVYAAATKREQAKIVWGEARQMVMATPSLRERITPLVLNLSDHSTNSKFEPLGADADNLDGLNIHGVIIDELHAHRTRALWDVLMTAMGARRQPLAFIPTTAGSDRESIWWEQHDRGIKILEGAWEDDAFFAYIATLDACEACRATGVSGPTDGCPDCDDWRDERVWIKASPNLDVSVKRDTLREECRRAQENPSARYAFLQKRMNMPTVSETAWFTPDQWAMGNAPVDALALRGRPCVAGLDLASTTDLAALVLIFPDEEFFVEQAPRPGDYPREDFTFAEPQIDILGVTGSVDILAWFWCPADRIRERSKVDRVPYETWRQQGYIEATPGNVIDYRYIRARIKALCEEYHVAEICYDPAHADQIAQQLHDEDGFTVVPVRQGFNTINEPCMLLEMLVEGKRLCHGGNPVMAWCAANVVKDTDRGGRIRPTKGRQTARIDGISALVTGLKRIIAAKGMSGSVYDARGIETF
jgi:phage terminase large subunit-like protein